MNWFEKLKWETAIQSCEKSKIERTGTSSYEIIF